MEKKSETRCRRNESMRVEQEERRMKRDRKKVPAREEKAKVSTEEKGKRRVNKERQ